MNYFNILVLIKYLISRITIIDNYCKRCGKDTEPFYVDDDLWISVVGDKYKNLELCFHCFDLINIENRLYKCWTVTELK